MAQSRASERKRSTRNPRSSVARILLAPGGIVTGKVLSFGRILCIVVGIGILSLAFAGPKTPWAYLGIVPLATGIIGMCPLYARLGFSTCRSCK